MIVYGHDWKDQLLFYEGVNFITFKLHNTVVSFDEVVHCSCRKSEEIARTSEACSDPFFSQ